MLDMEQLTAVCRKAGAEIAPAVRLSELTTFKIGGACEALVILPDSGACQTVIQYLRDHEISFALIGRGSNLLVPDQGYQGVILKLSGALASDITEQNGIVTCGAGESLKNLCLFALEHSLTGLEFAYGIPGSVGGAIFMNAGAYNGEFSQVLHSVTILDETGAIRTLDASALNLGYRHSVFMEKPWIILQASVQLNSGEPDAIREKMQDLLGRRKAKQPLEYPSAGSTFKRPVGSYASKLIDECGLKGYTVGGAQVSEKHAGFVVNRGGATFADVMAVCRHVQETVKAQTGFILELEPEILGSEVIA